MAAPYRALRTAPAGNRPQDMPEVLPAAAEGPPDMAGVLSGHEESGICRKKNRDHLCGVLKRVLIGLFRKNRL